MEVVYWLQIIIVPTALLWAYTRYSKRRAVTYSVANAAVNWVDCIVTSEHSKSFVVSYGYSVNGVRHFGTFTPAGFGFGALFNHDENLKKLRSEYPVGHSLRVFYWPSFPDEHWLHEPPSRLAVLWVAFRVPLITAFLLNIPLLFIRFLVILSAS